VYGRESVELDRTGWVAVDVDKVSGGFEAVYQAEHRPLLRLAYA